MKTYAKKIHAKRWPRGASMASGCLTAVLIGGLLGACNKGKPEEKPSAQAEAQQAKDKDSPVIANFGDREVRAAQFEAYLQFKRLAIRSEKELDQALERYVQDEALAAAAEQSNAAKKEGGFSEAELLAEVAEFRRNAIQAHYFSDFLAGAVTRQAVEDYYRDHGQEYEEQRVRIAHILVRAQRATSDKDRAEKRAKIEAAAQQLKQGKPFADVAKRFSDDQVSAARGGEMGWIGKGAIDPRLSEVAFGLTAGATSDPFETGFGYQIIKVLEGPETVKKPLTAVDGQIRQKLRTAAKLAEEKRLRDLVAVKFSRGSWKPSTMGALPAAPQPKVVVAPKVVVQPNPPIHPSEPAAATPTNTGD